MTTSSSPSNTPEEVLSIQEQEQTPILNEEKLKQTTTTKKYGCFVTGESPKDLIGKHGNYGDMLINFLKEEDKNEEWLRFDPRKDEFPTETQLQEISGFVITGSPSDAHSNEPWVVKLRNYCNQLYTEKSHKMMGFCFGHQLLAIAINGKSGRAKSGWEIGLRTLQFTSQARDKIPALHKTILKNKENDNNDDLKCNDMDENKPIELNLYEFHQDQVYELPSNATILASSKYCPIEMFEADNVILGIQGHPEFNKEYYHDALLVPYLDSNVRTFCKNSLEEVIAKKTNSDVFQIVMREWFKKDL